jgi:hypothetical protein
MSMSLSPNTQAILLLMAPLIVGRNEPSADLLTPAEYKRLARFLRESNSSKRSLAPNARQCSRMSTAYRQQPLKRLLGRGFS